MISQFYFPRETQLMENPFVETELADITNFASMPIYSGAGAFDNLAESLQKLKDLPRLIQESANDLDKVNPETLLSARQFLEHLYKLIINNNFEWSTPHISTDGSGEITLEWWDNNHNLSIFVYPNGDVSYLQAWGPNIWCEMADGLLSSDDELITIWKWLHERSG